MLLSLYTAAYMGADLRNGSQHVTPSETQSYITRMVNKYEAAYSTSCRHGARMPAATGWTVRGGLKVYMPNHLAKDRGGVSDPRKGPKRITRCTRWRKQIKFSF